MLLNFTSWWFEHNRQHNLTLNFDCDSGTLRAQIEDLAPVIIESPITGTNRKLESLDLFIGSEIDVLGKPTVLKSCDPKTAEWNENKAHKLISLRTRLMEEIRKYESKPFSQWVLASHRTNIPGGFNLRGIDNQVNELRRILMKYRTDYIDLFDS